mmetsp:Transcript_32119/g.52613  ORF Transcript_32119/g.52613 Transcript_32119/m.52613 type:complete len:84 (-) Transcript_32119:158-409(-)
MYGARTVQVIPLGAHPPQQGHAKLRLLGTCLAGVFDSGTPTLRRHAPLLKQQELEQNCNICSANGNSVAELVESGKGRFMPAI